MLAESGLLHDLERHAFSTGGQPLCIYGDPAYPLRVHLQGPFQGAALTPQMEMFMQWIHELCSSVSGVAVWRHFKLF